MYGRDILGPETNAMEKRPYPLRIHGTNGIFTPHLVCFYGFHVGKYTHGSDGIYHPFIRCMSIRGSLKETHFLAGSKLRLPTCCYLENKLLLLSINFTPKTSHSCLKKGYVFQEILYIIHL